MIVTAWNNGSWNSSGAGYGIRISIEDRDQYFRPEWKSVIIVLDDHEVEVKLSESFWNKCPELRKKEIGVWLIKNGLGRWPKGNPPKLKLEPVGDRRFKLSLI